VLAPQLKLGLNDATGLPGGTSRSKLHKALTGTMFSGSPAAAEPPPENWKTTAEHLPFCSNERNYPPGEPAALKIRDEKNFPHFGNNPRNFRQIVVFIDVD
jgi:hypothetical protein